MEIKVLSEELVVSNITREYQLAIGDMYITAYKHWTLEDNDYDIADKDKEKYAKLTDEQKDEVDNFFGQLNIKGEKNQQIFIPFSDEDLYGLQNESEYNWTFDGIDVCLFKESYCEECGEVLDNNTDNYCEVCGVERENQEHNN